MSLTVRIALVLVLIGVLLPTVVSACPLCKDAKSDADYAGGHASLPTGFFYSVLFMVAAPFTVIGGFILRVCVARRRLRTRLVMEGAGSPPVPLVPDSRGARF